jgi:histone-lysine N-methyltransferase SETMAR
MLTAIGGVNGFHLMDLMPPECRFNTQYFVEHVMAPLVQTVFPQGRTRYTPGLNIHLDNCRVHFSKVTERFFIENQLLHVPRPPYSPDLAPSDFWLFRRIKTGFAGRSLNGPKELLEGVREFMEGIPVAELTVVCEGWIDRVRWVIAHNGQHYSSYIYAINLGFQLFVPGSAAKTY